MMEARRIEKAAVTPESLREKISSPLGPRARDHQENGAGDAAARRLRRTVSRPSNSLAGGLGQLVSRRRFACGANQPIRLFQNVGIFWLFSRKKADTHERRAK